jgi:hypothetical protein
MAATDYTDIVARFSDQVAAETLAQFISSLGFPCDLVELSNPAAMFDARYAIRVARSSVDDLVERLQLTKVASYAQVVSAHVVAGRLAREEIPSYVGGSALKPLGYAAGLLGPFIDGEFGPGTLAVPASYVRKAQQVLEAGASEADLTELALSYPFDPKDPP